MPDTRSCTYEDLYYEMWEMSLSGFPGTILLLM